MDTKRIRFTGPAISVRGNDIDTDRIIPARFLRCVTFDGLGDHAFEDDRLQLAKAGKTHPFDDPRFAGARLLFVNKNFGCGSSREHAPQSIMRWGDGIQAVIGESFSEIFFGNCVALGMPAIMADAATIEALMAKNEADPKSEFTVNLEALTIASGGDSYPLNLPEGPRQSFLEGAWDTTAELLSAKSDISNTAANVPYFGHWQ